MKRLIILLITSYIANQAHAQIEEPDFGSFQMKESFVGDLNGDGFKDKIVLYEQNCEEEDDQLCKRLAIFENDGKGDFNFVSYNDEIIDCKLCGGSDKKDKFQALIIREGFFSLQFKQGPCDKTYFNLTFKYDADLKEYFLDKIDTMDYSCSDRNPKTIVASETHQTEDDFGKISFKDFKQFN